MVVFGINIRIAGKEEIPSSNSVFWKTKLERNINKDKKDVQMLENLGWKVLVIWECEVENQIETVLNKVQKVMRNK